MKPSNRRAIIVGIFIFLGLAIFIVAVLTLGSQHKTFEKAISIKAIFDNVNGLQKGNNIWYSGVKVGTIKRVALAANSLVEVTMNIEKSSSKFIHKNATAKISSDGLIGNRIGPPACGCSFRLGTSWANCCCDSSRRQWSLFIRPIRICLIKSWETLRRPSGGWFASRIRSRWMRFGFGARVIFFLSLTNRLHRCSPGMECLTRR